MLNYADLEWFIMFPFLCGVMMWFSIDLALLVRIAGGRRRRKEARAAIEQMVLRAPAVPNRSPSPSPSPSSPTAACPPVAPHGGNGHASTGASATRHRAVASTAAAAATAAAPENSTRSPDRSGVTGASDFPSPRSPAPPSPPSPHPQRKKRFKKMVDIPTAMRVATKAVTRRAVVVVGGDFARSPRMQYHATSLAQSGLFDEIVLVGFNCGNELSESLRRSGVAAPEVFHLNNSRDKAETQRVVWEVFRQPHDRRTRDRTGCLVSVRYLTAPPTPPEWLQFVFPIRRLHWVACTLYRAVAFLLLFSWLLMRATAIRVNAHGQLLLTDLVLVQTPPAVPFVLLIKYIVRPLCFLYSGMLYYAFIVPASWFNGSAVKELRELSCSQTDPIFTGSHAPLVQTSPLPSMCVSSPDGSGSDNNASVTQNRGEAARALYRHQHVVSSNNNRRKESTRDGSSVVSLSSTRRQLQEWWRAGLIRWSVFWPSLIVDWHNFGYTILQAARRPAIVVATYKFLELHCCAGDINVTVSCAMKRFLLENHVVPAECVGAVTTRPLTQGNAAVVTRCDRRRGSVVPVLYDVPPSFFRPTSRATFVEEVVIPTNRITAEQRLRRASRGDGAKKAGKPSQGLYNRQSSAAPSATIRRSEADDDGVGLEEARREATLRDGGWGINSPPAWVVEEVAGTSVFPAGGANAHIGGPPEHDSNAIHPTTAKKRGIMIVGATSWTEDDDYGVLIEALQRLDHRLKHEYKYIGNPREATPTSAADSALRSRSPSRSMGDGGNGQPVSAANADAPTGIAAEPGVQTTDRWAAQSRRPLDVWVLITGKGPARQRFEDAVRAANLSSHVVVSTVYLQSYQQYSTTIGAADVGLCLHFSSSGLDLPMKGVDMVGSGLPIVAYDYPAIEELMGPRRDSPNSIHSSASGCFALSSATGSSSSGSSGGGGGSLVECERGWVFSNATALEKLLGAFIGLDDLAGGAIGWSGSGLSSPLSSRLAAVQQRTRNAPRSTWEANWNAVLKPILDEIV